MSIDLTGGLDPELEYFIDRRPDNPAMRDSATLWVMPSNPQLAFPRITIDAIGEDWEHPWIQLNMVMGDGRALRLWTGAAAHPGVGPDGRPSQLGAGPLRFECIEPFRHWRVSFEGEVEQTTTSAQMAGERGGEPVPLSFLFDARMAAPPWVMGGKAALTAGLQNKDAANIMGGRRYEQLCRVEGKVTLDGESYAISGTGMRVRRCGVRNMVTAYGHCQHSALFPSGRGFGAIAMAPGPDGAQSFNEGFVYTGQGEPLVASISSAPWMRELHPHGEDVSLELAAGDDVIRIESELLLATFDHHLFEMADDSVLQQGVARYRWDGEETIGLIERCSLRGQLKNLA